MFVVSNHTSCIRTIYEILYLCAILDENRLCNDISNIAFNMYTYKSLYISDLISLISSHQYTYDGSQAFNGCGCVFFDFHN